MTVTAVIVSRNDNYGGSLNERATYCLNSMINSFEQVIYVDWNSPTNETLVDVIEKDLLHTGKLLSIRVPREFHEEYFKDNTDPYPPQVCVEVLGRNIGIRRAIGDIIISTNIDIIAPRTIICAPDKFYILARRDINLDEVLKLGNYQDIQHIQDDLSTQMESYGHAPTDVVMFEGDVYSLVGYCGDFQVASKELWHKIRGFEEILINRGYADTHVQIKAAHAGAILTPYTALPVFHIRHGGGLGGGSGLTNSLDFIRTLTETTNDENWGFADVDFEAKII